MRESECMMSECVRERVRGRGGERDRMKVSE